MKLLRSLLSHQLSYLTDDLRRLHDHFLRQSLKLCAGDNIRIEGFLLGFILKFGAPSAFAKAERRALTCSSGVPVMDPRVKLRRKLDDGNADDRCFRPFFWASQYLSNAFPHFRAHHFCAAARTNTGGNVVDHDKFPANPKILLDQLRFKLSVTDLTLSIVIRHGFALLVVGDAIALRSVISP